MTITTSSTPVAAGRGYQYLTASVAAGDGELRAADALLRYYDEAGTPPGQWLGDGLAGLGDGWVRSGSRITEEQMLMLFGWGRDPVTSEPLGHPFTIPLSVAQRVKARLQQMPAGLSEAERAEYEARVREEERDRRPPASRAGFDLTFQLPKSASTLWAISDAGVQAQIVRAHHQAMRETLALIEREVLMTRAGRNGVVQLETHGLVAAAFDHYDTRAGDPHLHTHVLVANRVQGVDGKWRTLDSRALYRALVAMSRTHESLFADRLAQYLPVVWAADSPEAARMGKIEIAGVPKELREEFSQRRMAILAQREESLAEFRSRHGRDPSERESRRLDQLAWQTTRHPKKQGATLAELTARWRTRALEVLARLPGGRRRRSALEVPEDAARWVRDLLVDAQERPREPVLRDDDLTAEQLASYGRRVLAVVAQKRSTWTRWNLHSEAAAALTTVRFATAEDRLRVIDAVVDHATRASVLVTTPALAHTPDAFRRSDGTSAFDVRHGQVYTSRDVLAAEDYLLTRVRAATGPVVDERERTVSLERFNASAAHALTADQVLAIEQITASGRGVDMLVGPAGAGKTTTLAALLATWTAAHGPGSVVGLAPSAAAADVLGSEMGIATDNTTKWLTELDARPQRQARLRQLRQTLADMTTSGNAREQRAELEGRIAAVSQDLERWSLRAGDLLVVDEASLAGTFALERIARDAEASGAKVVLVGDPLQLSAVEAGGAFSMAAHELGAGAPRLHTIHRFAQSWEAEASLMLRVGRAEVLESYAAHDRLREGREELMLDAAYAAWQGDTAASKTSLLVASDNETVQVLNLRAQRDLIAAGQVQPGTTRLADTSRVGIGDVIVTRKNDRTLATAGGWVKNGDRWRVVADHQDGSLMVQRETGGPHIALPAHYVGEHVELGYAATTHRAQGATVDTAHALVMGTSTTREALYVAATRGRQANHVYVATSTTADAEAHLPPEQVPSGIEVLTGVLRNVGAATSAHQQIASDQDAAASIATLSAEYDTLAVAATAQRWDDLITVLPLTEDQRREVTDSPSWPALQAALRRATTAGMNPERGLPALLAAQEIDSADDLGAVLHTRVEAWSAAAARTGSNDGKRYVCGLLPRATGVTDRDLARALVEREDLMSHRADALVSLASQAGHEWARPPADDALSAEHAGAAATVAAYRDKWGVDRGDRRALGGPVGTDLHQRAERRRAEHALRTIATLHKRGGIEPDVVDVDVGRAARGPVLG